MNKKDVEQLVLVCLLVLNLIGAIIGYPIIHALFHHFEEQKLLPERGVIEYNQSTGKLQYVE